MRDAADFKNAIIFCNRKRDVAMLHKSLQKHGFNAGALHGDLDQRARTASLDAFKSGEVALIVCSDVAARGLDIPDVSHVFNFDVPTHAEDYVHRIGRTGRAGKSGVAISIVTRADQKHIAEIEKLIARKIDWIGGETMAELKEDDEAEGPSHRERSSSRRTAPHRGEAEQNDARPAETESGEPRRSRRRDKTDSPRPREENRDLAEATPRAAVAEPAPPAPERERRPRRQETRQDSRRDSQRDVGQASRQENRHDSRRDDKSPVVGMGDHVPMFLLRPVKLKPAKQTSDDSDVAESNHAG